MTVVVAGPAALADKPIKATEEFTTEGPLADCGDFGVLGIENWTLASWEFYKKGDLNRIQFHAAIDGTTYNSEEPDKAFSSVAHYNFVTYAEDLFVIRDSSYGASSAQPQAPALEAGNTWSPDSPRTCCPTRRRSSTGIGSPDQIASGCRAS